MLKCYFAYGLILSAFVTGCSTPGFPRRSYDEKNQIQQLEKEVQRPNLITEYYGLVKTNASEAVLRAERDKLISGRLALIDLNYNQFVARFSVTRQSLDFGTEVTQFGLNLATTAVGGAGTKTVLAAIAAGVTGSKIAIDKNFFFEKTVPVLVTSMNAQRKEALEPIMSGMQHSSADYSFNQALSDIDAYYFAGTFVGALQAIQADAGAKDVKAAEKLNQIRTQKFAQDESGTKLQVYWMPGSPSDLTVDKDHQDKLRKWLKDNGLDAISIQSLINGALLAEARKRAATELIK